MFLLHSCLITHLIPLSLKENTVLFAGKDDENDADNEQKPLSPHTAQSKTVPQGDLIHRALLVGGTKRSITDFAQRLQKRGIAVEIRERTSKTAKGKTMKWYQAVTAPHAQKDELTALVDTIKKFEKLKDVEIISMRSPVSADQKGNS